MTKFLFRFTNLFMMAEYGECEKTAFRNK